MLHAVTALAAFALVLVSASPALAVAAPAFLDSNGMDVTAVTLDVDENDRSDLGGAVSVGTVAATDSDGDTLTYSVSGTHAWLFGDGSNQLFELNTTTGKITIADFRHADYESGAQYTVTINVTDSKDSHGAAEGLPVIDDSVTVTININNLEEPGSVSVSGATQVGNVLAAAVSDPDVVKSATVTWQWSGSSSPHAGFVSIDSATSASYQVANADDGMYLQVTASYEDRHDPGKSSSATTAPVGTLVSNSLGTYTSVIESRTAQRVSTGNHSSGYAVSAVGISTTTSMTVGPRVRVLTDSAGEPGELLAELDAPGELTADAFNNFPGPSVIVLEANTDYWIEVSAQSRTDTVSWWGIGRTTEDPGKSVGWEIADGRLNWDQTCTCWDSLFTEVGLLVKGQPRNALNSSSPSFANASVTLSVNENAEVDASVGTVAATDADGDQVFYSVVAKSVSAADMTQL